MRRRIRMPDGGTGSSAQSCRASRDSGPSRTFCPAPPCKSMPDARTFSDLQPHAFFRTLVSLPPLVRDRKPSPVTTRNSMRLCGDNAQVASVLRRCPIFTGSRSSAGKRYKAEGKPCLCPHQEKPRGVEPRGRGAVVRRCCYFLGCGVGVGATGGPGACSALLCWSS